MTRLASLALLPFVLLVPAFAPVAAVRAAEPVHIVQPGDNALGCEALAAEITRLDDRPSTSASAEVAKPKKHGFGGLMKVLGSAAPFVPGVGGIAGSLVMATASAAQSDATQSRMADVEEASHDMAMRALAGPSAAEQRRERLTGIFDAKRC